MRGILFTEILYNKTIRKEKTMTRRAGASLKAVNESPDDWAVVHSNLFSNGCLNVGFTQSKIGQGLTWHNCESNYRVGEVLYIKEPVADYRYEYFTGQTSETRTAPAYKYGCREGQAVVVDLHDKPYVVDSKELKFQNKMFVGSNKARAYIRITDVRIERLYDISDEDCLKEGIEWDYDEDLDGDRMVPIKHFMDYYTMEMKLAPEFNAFDSYESLFKLANKYPKNKEVPNLWVWVYDYVLCNKEGKEL